MKVVINQINANIRNKWEINFKTKTLKKIYAKKLEDINYIPDFPKWHVGKCENTDVITANKIWFV